MPAEFLDDIRDLANWIFNSGAAITFLDGECGSGKSWLASKLSEFGLVELDMDKFIRRDEHRYVGALNLDAAQEAIAAFQSKQVVISCICARDVADQLRIAAANFVYVVRMSEVGVEEYSPAHNVERDGAVIIDPVLMPEIGSASREVFDYHVRVRPRSKANALFRNTVSDN